MAVAIRPLKRRKKSVPSKRRMSQKERWSEVVITYKKQTGSNDGKDTSNTPC